MLLVAYLNRKWGAWLWQWTHNPVPFKEPGRQADLLDALPRSWFTADGTEFHTLFQKTVGCCEAKNSSLRQLVWNFSSFLHGADGDEAVYYSLYVSVVLTLCNKISDARIALTLSTKYLLWELPKVEARLMFLDIIPICNERHTRINP